MYDEWRLFELSTTRGSGGRQNNVTVTVTWQTREMPRFCRSRFYRTHLLHTWTERFVTNHFV